MLGACPCRSDFRSTELPTSGFLVGGVGGMLAGERSTSEESKLAKFPVTRSSLLRFASTFWPDVSEFSEATFGY